MVSLTDCKIPGSDSTVGGITKVFALLRRLLKNHIRLSARTFYDSSEEGSIRTLYRGLHLESLRVLTDMWTNEPITVLLRTLFSERAVIPSKCELAFRCSYRCNEQANIHIRAPARRVTELRS